MAGTQAPKGFGLAFALIGVPLIFWSASGTNQKVAALDTPESRQASCVAKLDGLGVKGTQAMEMCGCIVERAAAAGITEQHGAYDEKALAPIVNACYADHVE